MSALAELSAVKPAGVLQLLIRRIDREVDQKGSGYEALPQHWGPALKVRETPHLATQLTYVRNWMVRSNHAYHLRDAGAELFTLVAGVWDEQAIAVLHDLGPGKAEDALLVVARLLAQAPSHVLFEQAGLVSESLRHAQALGGDVAERVMRTMALSDNFHVRTVWADEASGEDVQQRDRAAKVASQLPRGSIERKFFEALAEDAEQRISWSTDRTEPNFDGRDW